MKANPASMINFMMLRDYYRSGEIQVNDNGVSILQRPLTFTPRLMHILHDERIPVQVYGNGQDGFTLSPLEFGLAYPFENLTGFHLNDFRWWTWPQKALHSCSYNATTRAFHIEVSLGWGSRSFANYLDVLKREGFIACGQSSRFTYNPKKHMHCQIFINKGVVFQEGAAA